MGPLRSLDFAPDRAQGLAWELLARAQGVNMMTHVFAAPDYLLEQQETLNRWIDDRIAEPQRPPVTAVQK